MSGILSGNDGVIATTGDARSLSDVVIDDFIASIQSNTFSRALDSAGRLSASDVATLKATIRNKVASDGLGASKNIDKILPSVMEGISAGVKNLAAIDSDTVVSAQLLSKAMKSTSESLSKNAATLSTPSVVLSDVLKVVVKKGAADLAVIAATDPESAGKALQAAVKEVSTALKSNSTAISETVVLQTVVTASVQAAVENNRTGLVQAIFTGTAQATTDASVVGDVVKDAVMKACDGGGDKILDSAIATDLLKQASAGLSSSTLPSTNKVVIDDALLNKTTVALESRSVTISAAVVIEVKKVVSEPDPVAELSAKIDNVVYVANDEFPYSENVRTVEFTTSGSADFTEELIDPNGVTLVGKTYQLSGSGTFRFILLVKSKTGAKSAYKTLLIRVKALATEIAPVANLTVKEGNALVNGTLTWTKEGHSLTFDTTGSTGSTATPKIQILSDNATAKPIKDPLTGIWSVVQKMGTVNYTLVVQNEGSEKKALKIITVTVAPEPVPAANLTVKKDGFAVTSLAFNPQGYDLILDLAGSTLTNTELSLDDGGKNTVLVKNTDGTWTAKAVLETTTFTLTVKNVGGLQSSTKAVTVSIGRPTPSSDVSADVKAGQTAIKNLDLNAAKTSFNLAIAKSPTDNDARIWSALVDLSSVAVHPEVVDLMRNKIGVVDYPADMNTLLGTTWLNSKFYGTRAGMVDKGPGKGYYVRGRTEVGDPTYNYGYYGYDQNANSIYSNVMNQKFVPDEAGTVYAYSWSQSKSEYHYGWDYPAADASVPAYRFYSPDGSTYTLNGNNLTGYVETAVLGTLSDAPADYSYSSVKVIGADGKLSYIYNKLFTPSASGTTYATYWYNRNEVKGDASAYLKANPTVSGYVSSWNLINLTNPQLFPTIAPVTGFQAMGGAAPDGYTMGDWSRLITANILTRNSAGFNAAVDQVLNGPLGTNLDSIISRLNSVDETYRTTIPADMILKFSSTTVPEGTTISVGKPELLLMVANLKVQRAFVQYLASVNLNYPIHSSFVNAMMIEDVTDADKSGVPDFLETFVANTPGLYFSSLLTERSASARLASKSSFLSALADIQKAVSLYQAAVDGTGGYYRDTVAGIVGTMDTSGYYTQAKTGLANAQTGLTKLTSAITDNTSLLVPSTGSPSDLVGASFVWPVTDAKDGKTLTVNPGALWAENALDFRKWFVGDATKGFKYMVYASSGSNVPVFTPKELPADRSTMDAAYWGLNLDGTSYVYMYGGVGLAPNVSMYQKFYPATPSNLGVSGFGVSWPVVSDVSSTYNYNTGKYTYTYNRVSFKPDAAAELMLKWVNKQ